MSTSANSENTLLSVSNTTPVAVVEPDPKKLADLLIVKGKSFKESSLSAGYPAYVAHQGLKALMARDDSVCNAIERARNTLITLDKLKPLAVRRLHDEIVNPKSSQGIKAIELAGRFKETDWFVRSVDVQIGVFASLGDNSPAEDVLDAYKTEE